LALLHYYALKKGDDVEFKVLDVATGKVRLTHVFQGDVNSHYSLNYRGDGRLIVIEVLDNTVKLWELAAPKK
jgi:hypothetical protein